jgi:ADP-heptose:LPS heptosyltransferase
MNIIIGLIEHIGDIAACEPVSRYIRYTYPDAHLSWAVHGSFRELIDCNPHIDETVVLDCLTDWMKLVAHGSFDRVFDLHVNYRVCPHCRIPLVKTHGNPFINAYEWLDHGALLEAFSQAAGLPKLSSQPQLYLGPEHRSAVDALGLPDQFCVVHRQSNDKEKDWTDDRWQALAKWIAAEIGLPIVEVGAGKMAGPSPLDGLAINLINRTPILQTAEVIRRARFCVAIDSGPAHLANAVKTPGIVMLGRIGHFRQYTPFTGYYASEAPDVKIVRNLTGPVSAIPVADVADAIRYVSNILDARISDSRTLVKTPAEPRIREVTDRERAVVRGSGKFDAAWYSLNHPETLGGDVNPLDHFIGYGGHLGFAPGPSFDCAAYLKEHPDVAAAGVNPLMHYLDAGQREGRAVWVTTADYDSPSEIVSGALMPLPPIPDLAIPENEIPRAFAFYLPQFHPIPENNLGHRMGFTEWDNVIKATPLFQGHYQPRVPGELGYYDLRAPEVLRDQVALAIEHGISGFCFYYYYFAGKKILNKPISNFIESDLDFPFFMLWANENWSRRWDGGDHEVIIAQEHSREDDLAFICDIANLFSDKRYVKINGKPILMVYKIHLFPNILETVELWRTEIVKLGFPGIYLVMVDDWTSDPVNPRQFGFDASYEIPSNVVPEEVLAHKDDAPGLVEDFQGRIVDYRKFAQFHMGRPFPEYKRFRTVMLPWDNTPRYAARSMVQINTGGDAYTKWLTEALLDTYNRYEPDERIVFVHSWNEWCEGTYLEPDGKYGRRYLLETRDAVADARAAITLDQPGAACAVIPGIHRLIRENERGAFRVMNSMRRQFQYLYREIDALRQSKLDFERSFYESRSWRLTAPVRWLADRLRRG